MKCRFAKTELSAYIDGELDNTQRRSIEAHLRACPDCRGEVEALRNLSRTLSLAPPAPTEVRVRARLARQLALTEEAPRFTCARVQGLLSERLDGALTADQEQRLQAHLDHCPACAGEAVALDAVLQTVRALPEVEPPLGLERCIRAAIAKEERGFFARWFPGILRSPRLTPGLATASVAATLVAGFWLGRILPNTPGTPGQQPPAVAYQGEPTGSPAPGKTPHTVAAASPQRPAGEQPTRGRQMPASTLRSEPLMPMAVAAQAPVLPALPPAPRTPLPWTRPKETPPAPVKMARMPFLPVPQPLPPVTTPTDVPAPATPAAPPATTPPVTALLPPTTTVTPDEPAPRPALGVALTAKIEGHPADSVRNRHAYEEWKKAQEDLRQTFAQLNGQSPDRAVRATIASVSWR